MYKPDWRKLWQLASLLAIALLLSKQMQILTQVKMMSKPDWNLSICTCCKFRSQAKKSVFPAESSRRILLHASCILLALHHHTEGAYNFRVQPNTGSVSAKLADLRQLNVLLVQLTTGLLEDRIHNLGSCHAAHQHECI